MINYKGKVLKDLNEKGLTTINKFILPDELVKLYPYLAEKTIAFALLHLRKKQGNEHKWLFGWITEQPAVIGFSPSLGDSYYESCRDLIHFYTTPEEPYFAYDIHSFDPLITSGNKGVFSDNEDVVWNVPAAYPLFYVEGNRKKGFKFLVDPKNMFRLGKIARKTPFDRYEVEDVFSYFCAKAFCNTKLVNKNFVFEHEED